MITIGRLIGRGKTSEVFEFGPGKVIKLYFSHIGKGLNEYEYEVGKLIRNAGVPAPAVFDIMTIDDRSGLVMENAGDETMFTAIIRRPWLAGHFARRMARLHADIHKCHDDSLVTQHQVIISKIAQSEELLADNLAALHYRIAALPSGTSICHGDFHPKNIFRKNSAYMAIDWADLSYGHPAGDVARTCIILLAPHTPDGYRSSKFFLSPLKKLITRAYLREYTRLTGIDREEISPWMVPVAAGRLKEEIPGERDWLLSIVKGQRKLEL